MDTIAYRIGWDRARLKARRQSPEYDPNFVPEVNAETLSHLFNKKEMKECIKGMHDFLLFNVAETQRQEKEDKRREELIEQIEQVKAKKRTNSFLFFMALASGRHINSHSREINNNNYSEYNDFDCDHDHH